MVVRLRLFPFAAALCLASGSAATAAELPAIKAGDGNQVPACVTPGRLMAFAKARNEGLDARFAPIATEYMRHGEEFGLRWDYAFFQMMVETGNLSFRRGNGRPGDVKPAQNNFAGLGATGGGQPGESFPDVSTGVKAHLQHVMLYAGEPVADPVAERTRKVKEWGILTSWQKGFKRPIRYSDLTKRWSPGDGGYSNDIQSVASRFQDDFCGKPDPAPELVAEARGGSAKRVAGADAEEKVSGAELARQAAERAKAEGQGRRQALGAGNLARAAGPAQPEVATEAKPEPNKPTQKPAVTMLNVPKTDEPARTEKPAKVEPASAATATKPTLPPAQAASESGTSKCRVWTASYGGQKAIIIKAITDQVVNYTVLDVNEGAEKREAEAYIAAYAKGGQLVGEFASQTQALDKAFDLCPDG